MTHAPDLAPDPAADDLSSRPMSSMALAGFVCTLVWLWGVSSLVGLVLCAVAWRTETGNGLKGGHRLAVAGVVLGSLGTLWSLAVVLAWFGAIASETAY